jgi:cell division protein FtsQ
MSFVSSERKNTKCVKVICTIDSRHAFVDTSDVYSMLRKDLLFPVGKKMSDISLIDIETILETHEAIKNVEVYSDVDGIVNLLIQQRNPVLRIITKNNNHYYVDDDFGLMSVGYEYAADVPVLSGDIPDTMMLAFGNGNDTLSVENCSFQIHDMIEFGDFLYQNELWRNQIVQIYVNEKSEIELIPRVGNHVIILGELNNYKYKMKKLEAIYLEAFPKYGWKKYKTINLKYSNQVVCSK